MDLRIRCLTMAAATLGLLAACGGGNSGGSPSATPSPSPSSSSNTTPTPTASETYPPAPLATTGPVTYDLIGWQKNQNTGVLTEAAPQDFTFAWDGAAYYNVAIANVGTGRLRYFFSRTGNAYAFSLERVDGVVIPVGISIPDMPPKLTSPTAFSWRYPASGTAPSPPVEFSGANVLGRFTASAAIPRSGARTYRYQVEGFGTTQFTADFAAGTIDGSFAVSYQDAFGPYAPIPTRMSAVSWSTDRTTFTATYSIDGVPGEGSLKGRFFGPNAEYVGLIWQNPMSNPYDSRIDQVYGAWRLDPVP